MADEIYSVHQVAQALLDLFEEAIPPLWVEGEVSNFRESQAGHWYFTLRDAQAQLPVVMWRNLTFRHRHLKPEDGALIRVHGSLTIYPQGGVYQMRASRVLPVGQGALMIAFERLRNALRKEGLFDDDRKRPLPAFPKHIGVITSPRGAAVRDILKVIGDRFPCVEVTVYPVVVQGDNAPPEIERALVAMSRIGDADVLIVGRGGGSVEDLWAFNDERVVRAIAASTVPVISAVGHEVDFTLSDFAADFRAPTPSVAGERVVPDRVALLNELRSCRARLREAMSRRLQVARQKVSELSRALSPRRQRDAVRQNAQRVDDLAWRLENAARAIIARRRRRLESMAASLNALSPLSTLARGYSICYDADDAILRDSEAVSKGDRIRVRLNRGRLEATVREANHG